jgi:hypothetical protein
LPSSPRPCPRPCGPLPLEILGRGVRRAEWLDEKPKSTSPAGSRSAGLSRPAVLGALPNAARPIGYGVGWSHPSIAACLGLRSRSLPHPIWSGVSMVIALAAQAWSLRPLTAAPCRSHRPRRMPDACAQTTPRSGVGARANLRSGSRRPGHHASCNFRIVGVVPSRAMPLMLSVRETAWHDPVVAFS